MGFNEKWIQLVKNCIEQCWFSVLVNGDKAGFFSSSRGLRQGDPISPSLFIILAEYLARGLDQLFHRNPALRYYSKGGSDVTKFSVTVFLRPVYTTAPCCYCCSRFLRLLERWQLLAYCHNLSATAVPVPVMLMLVKPENNSCFSVADPVSLSAAVN
ncbi:hypothetical protein Sango_3039500 [Sesamum angolense]|uniref:Reverse transcriptase domain-containing protein n=1 Tax=Sesamum angolense TaxID=2727404 RepID=A0AAE1T9Q8_9LAMI|nr:hypothetical protein Sango_3039500 [Sesamum angolense]